MNRTFSIDIPDADLAALRRRLDDTRLPDVPPGVDGRGYPLDRMREQLRRWQELDWAAVQSRLNELPQRLIDVPCAGRTIPLHVVHVRGGDRIPVVVLHGWPDSVFAMRGLIEGLAAAGHDVVAPTLPGFPFSGQPAAPLGLEAVARAVDAAVAELGIDRYAVHGGDFGGAIAEQLALLVPERVVAIHLADVPYHHQFAVEPADASTDAERRFLEARDDWGDRGGYFAIQSTQPLTLAYGLADSPAGLLGWIGEKYQAWTDRRTDDDLVVTLASLFWFTNAIWSSMRLYVEGVEWIDDDAQWGDDAERDWASPACAVPSAFAIFPADIQTPPREFAERFFSDLRRFTLMPAGGHFSAHDEPTALAAEITGFLADLDTTR